MKDIGFCRKYLQLLIEGYEQSERISSDFARVSSMVSFARGVEIITPEEEQDLMDRISASLLI